MASHVCESCNEPSDEVWQGLCQTCWDGLKALTDDE